MLGFYRIPSLATYSSLCILPAGKQVNSYFLLTIWIYIYRYIYIKYRFLSSLSESYIGHLHLHKPQKYPKLNVSKYNSFSSHSSHKIYSSFSLSQNLSFILESTLSPIIPPKPISKSYWLYLLNISQMHLLLTISTATTLTKVKPPASLTWSTKNRLPICQPFSTLVSLQSILHITDKMISQQCRFYSILL